MTKVDENIQSEKETEILNFLIENKKITSAEAQGLLNISREMISRYFRRLIEKNKILKKGVGKSTYYVLRVEFQID